MKEVQLIRKSELSEGGCNACGVVEATSYTLKLGANKAIISELTVGGLVDSLALAEGFIGEDIYEMFSEIRQLKKGENCIEVHHESPNVRFKRGDNEMIFNNHMSDHTELYGIVNQILTELFGLGPCAFKEENGNPKLNEEWQETIETQKTTRTYFNRHPQYFVKGTLTRLLSKSHRFLSICVLNISFRVVTTGMTEM